MERLPLEKVTTPSSRIRSRSSSLQRKRAEENEKKFSQIFNSTSDGIVLIDPDSGAIVMSNRTAQEMFEYQPLEMEKLTLDSLIIPKKK